MSKIIHYRNKCIGCNSCVEQSPSRWKIDPEDGKSDLIGSKETKKGIFICTIQEDEVEANKRAARDCPVRIIKVEE
jgi:ferredoxin